MMEGPEAELFERGLRHAVESKSGASLDAALEELGWLDALRLDQRASISLLFGLQGYANAVSSALNELLRDRMNLDAGVGTIVLPAFGRWQPPGVLDNGNLVVWGLSTGPVDDRTETVVVAQDGERHVAAVVPFGTLTSRPIEGMDPWYGLCEVTGTSAQPRLQPVEWTTAVVLAQVALSYEMVGASRKMLELAREHALNRIQFGQPISRFQAVRHRLAETLVAIETAEAMLDGAWLDLQPQTAANAKAVAGRSAWSASRHCQQVLAGIGFTAEHPFHRYFRRVLVLDGIFGSSRLLTLEFGNQLLRTGRLPDLLPL